MSNDLKIKIDKIIDITVEHISTICDNIANYGQINSHYKNIESYTDSNFGNTVLGLKSTNITPFKIGYIKENDNTKITEKTRDNVKTKLEKFLNENGITTDNNSNITKKQFLILMSLIASFIYNHVVYFVKVD
jgi:hypothetical protein